ncbi:MAG: glycosyltransferase family 2 protein [Anaerolineae bacterium]
MSDSRPGLRLAIIIVNWNVRQLLAGCLTAIAASQRPPEQSWEVWVVDNASADGSADMVASEFPWVRLLRSVENLGFARGNNAALRQIGFDAAFTPPAADALPDFVLLLNPDTAVAPTAVSAMVQFLADHPNAGGCGAQLAYDDGRFQHGAFRFPDLWQLFFDFFPLHGRLLASRLNGRYPRAWYAAGQPFPIDAALGAALMVAGQAIEAVGLLDERYFMYCEEIDWCWRLHDAGWPLWCVPAARVTHFEGQSTRQFRGEMIVALWRSRLRLYAIRYSPLRRRVARAIVRVGMTLESRRARQQSARGTLTAAELALRLDAYGRVAALARS